MAGVTWPGFLCSFSIKNPDAVLDVCVIQHSLRMLAFIVPFCECFHEAATVDVFGVASGKK